VFLVLKVVVVVFITSTRLVPDSVKSKLMLKDDKLMLKQRSPRVLTRPYIRRTLSFPTGTNAFGVPTDLVPDG
jgi:hypothetical protein